MNYKKLNERAIAPTKANSSDAGYDLYALNNERLLYDDNRMVHKVATGIAMEIPDGYVGMICDRSSMAIKGIHVLGGIIDSSYRGEISVCLMNLGTDEDYKVNAGDRIAQILIIPVANFDLREVEALGETDRGNGGFGSTGK